MKTYQAILFAPDGEFVTDAIGTETVQDTWNAIENLGSRWIFYPIPFVGTDKTIVDTPDELKHLKYKRIETVQKMLQERYSTDAQAMCDELNAGFYSII